jgi:competence protein ComEC
VIHWCAVAAGIGAWFGLGTPVAISAGFALAAGTTRHRGALVLIVVLLITAIRFGQAIDGLVPPPDGPVDHWVTLTSDPRSFGSVGTRASARWGSTRVSVVAYGATAGDLARQLSGDQLKISGTFRGSTSSEWARWRHEVGTITITAVHSTHPGPPLNRFTNQIRRWLAGGAEALPRDDRATFLGMVMGDDREQSPVIADDFRAAGLGHLLVVSGQNVAFLLAVLEPLLRRGRPATRLVVVPLALLCFATLTRFEPSVLRAVGMAGVSVGSATIGLPIDSRKALSLAITALLMIDPFLVHAVAFQLSVAATVGIVWLASPLAARLPGPAVVRVAVATTVAAQVAVAPLLLVLFGPVPLMSLPANLLAGPVSGAIMIWGCTAGLVAGVFGGVVADGLHVPTRLMVGWVRWVARLAPNVPPFMLGTSGVALVAAGVLCALSSRSNLRRLVAILASVAIVASLATPATVPPGISNLKTATVLSGPNGVTVFLPNTVRQRQILEDLRLAGVTEINTLAVANGDAGAARAVTALRSRFPDLAVFAPPLHQVPGARTLQPGQHLVFAAATITTVSDGATTRLKLVRSRPIETVNQSDGDAKVSGDVR